jgi:hypothetical protein
MLTALAAQGSAHLVTRHSFYEKSRRAIRTGLVRAISPPAAASDAPLPPEH